MKERFQPQHAWISHFHPVDSYAVQPIFNQQFQKALCEYATPNPLALPLRIILNKINEAEKVEMEGANLLEVAMFLDRAHLDSLKAVQQQQDQMNAQIQSLNTMVNKFYAGVKEQLKSYVQKQVPSSDIMKLIFSTQLNEQNQLEQYLNQFVQNYQFTEQGDIVKLNFNQGVLNQCSNKFNELSDKLIELQKDFDKKIEGIKVTILLFYYQQDLYQPIQIEAIATQNTAVIFPQFRFSNTLKGFNITVSQGNLVAEQTGSESNGQRFIICEPGINKKGKTLYAFKIKKYQGWVGVGICHKDVISQAKFKFNYTTTGHGSYLISNNGYSWSHLENEFNSKHNAFEFNVGDVIYIEVDQNSKTISWKKNENGIIFTMQIKPGQDLYPCANLCSPGDTVELIQCNNIKF